MSKLKKTSPDITELQAISPLDGRYREKLQELAPYVSEMGLIKIRVEVEARYLIALSESGLLRNFSEKERKFLLNLGPNLSTDDVVLIKNIEKETRHDVKSVERALREILSKTTLKDVIEMIHFSLTSEDINNVSHRLLLQRSIQDICLPTLRELINKLTDMAKEYKRIPLLARTHGQPAVPTTLGKELVNFAMRLHTQKNKLESLRLTGKCTGAVGNLNAHAFAVPDVDWLAFSKSFIKSLDLEPNLFTTQINPYDDVIEVFQILERINVIILDLNQDMWRYISDDWFTQEVKKGEVGSSTMPQKVNPIDFENSEGNLQIANSLWEGMARKLGVSRLQRDLSDSTTVRNIGVGLGHGLLAYKSTLTGLGKIHPNTAVIEQELHKNWSILTEGVQTLMRVKGVKDPYKLIANVSRGQKIGKQEWKDWIDVLPVDKTIKQQLQALTPETYNGYAEQLTEMAIAEMRSHLENVRTTKKPVDS